MIISPPQRIVPKQFAVTFNCNGEISANTFKVDENALFSNVTQPYIVPHNGVFRFFTTSAIESGTYSYSISIYVNGVFQTFVTVTSATSVHKINIPVEQGDTVYIIPGKISGAGTLSDMICEMFAWFATSAPAILTPAQIFGSSLGWWFRAGDWTLTGSDIDTLDNLEGTASRDATGTSETAAFKPQAVVEDGLDACRFEGIDASFRREFFTWDTDFEALTECELFAVIKLDADPPLAGGNTGMWDTGTSAFPTNYPWIDSTIYDEAGRTTQFTTANPATSLTTQHCYNIRSQAATPIWANYLNGNNVITSSGAAFTYGFPATGRWGAGAAVYQQGYGWELIGLNTLASNAQRNLLGVYFASRGYSFTWANF